MAQKKKEIGKRLKDNQLELRRSSGQLKEALMRESTLTEELCNVSAREEKLKDKCVAISIWFS